jgi:DNA polymerase-4
VGDQHRQLPCAQIWRAQRHADGDGVKALPHLTLLPGRFEAYKEASNHIREIFSRYTSLIEPLSLDEAYLDVTDSVHCHGSATLMAQEIRQTIFNELNLTASAGVAPVNSSPKSPPI